MISSAGGSTRILSPLVGAVGFEPTTPCAQGGLRPPPKMPYFNYLGFKQMRASG